MRVMMAVCASAALVDRFSNQLSIFNVLEQIAAPGFPIWIPQITFIVTLQREIQEPPRFQTRVQVLLGETLIAENAVAIDFENNLTARTIMTFQGLPINGPGEIAFRFLLPNNESATAYVPIIHIPVAAPVQNAAT